MIQQITIITNSTLSARTILTMIVAKRKCVMEYLISRHIGPEEQAPIAVSLPQKLMEATVPR